MSGYFRPKKVSENIEAIMQKASDDISALGARYRDEVLIPLCSKYQLEYDCGNNSVYFTDEDDVSITSMSGFETTGMKNADNYARISASDRETFAQVFEDLEEQTIGNTIFGSHVPTIRKKDWEVSLAKRRTPKKPAYAVEISDDPRAISDTATPLDLKTFSDNLADRLEKDFKEKYRIEVKPVSSIVYTYRTTGPDSRMARKISAKAREICSDDLIVGELLNPVPFIP